MPIVEEMGQGLRDGILPGVSFFREPYRAPDLMAATIAATLLVVPVLVIALAIWKFTVRTLSSSNWAICGAVLPSPDHFKTSTSRGDSRCVGGAGRSRVTTECRTLHSHRICP